MFKVIHHNETKTVGIISGATNLKHMGAFNPKLLKEWLNEINEVFGDDIDEVQILVRKSDLTDSYAFYATPNGSDPMVMLAGMTKDEGNICAGEPL